MNDMLIGMTNRSWVAVLLGIGALAVAGYFKYKASGDNAVRPQAELAAVSGEVASVTEITMTEQRSRGGTTTQKYYEIEINGAKGAPGAKLHMPITTDRSMLEGIIEEPIEAKYDPDDGNAVYELAMEGKTLRSYAETAAIFKASAADSAKFLAQPLVFVGGALVLLLGIGGIILNRRLRRRA